METKPIEYSFQKDGIFFRDYHFVFSHIDNNTLLPFDKILGLVLNTEPCSIITTDKEVIFLNHNEDLGNLSLLAKEKGIPILDRPDIWEMICRIYLDSDATMIESDFEQLHEFGIDRKRLAEIRKKIDKVFSVPIEWRYLGHWDILANKQRTFLYGWTGKKFYWWTMQVATTGLANYR